MLFCQANAVSSIYIPSLDSLEAVSFSVNLVWEKHFYDSSSTTVIAKNTATPNDISTWALVILIDTRRRMIRRRWILLTKNIVEHFSLD